VAAQCGARRLVLVALGAGHAFASLAAVQAELSPLVRAQLGLMSRVGLVVSLDLAARPRGRRCRAQSRRCLPLYLSTRGRTVEMLGMWVAHAAAVSLGRASFGCGAFGLCSWAGQRRREGGLLQWGDAAAWEVHQHLGLPNGAAADQPSCRVWQGAQPRLLHP